MHRGSGDERLGLDAVVDRHKRRMIPDTCIINDLIALLHNRELLGVGISKMLKCADVNINGESYTPSFTSSVSVTLLANSLGCSASSASAIGWLTSSFSVPSALSCASKSFGL